MLPTSHADPAELVATGLITAHYVVATAVFLNCRLALWALFCVGMDPVVCFACGNVFKLFPFNIATNLSSSHFFFHSFNN